MQPRANLGTYAALSKNTYNTYIIVNLNTP